MFVSAIRKSLSLKVSLVLAATTLMLTAVVAVVVTKSQTKSLEDMTMTKARNSARIGAQTYGRLLDVGIDNNLLTVQDAFDRNYEEVKGYDWSGKPKYHTRYDFYTDAVVIPFQDRFLESDDTVFAMGADVNGYVPTHNGKYQKPLTGDATKDLAGNRTKRIFNDDVALKAGKNEEATLVQEYLRDTGEKAWDVSSPVYVKGKHWGCFRVGVSSMQIDKKRMALMWELASMFGGFAVLASAVIFLMLKRSMQPLVQLTDTR